MAKWGEGDPRWIVEERADATNVNNWHWTEKNASAWSKEKITSLLQGLKIQNDECQCEITEVTKCDGEASANNRKAKLIFFYEWEIKADWKGLIVGQSNKYKGSLEIPNLSDENDVEEVDVNISMKEEEAKEEAYKLKEFMRKRGTEIIREQLAIYMKDLKSEFSQGMILPTKDDKAGENAAKNDKAGENAAKNDNSTNVVKQKMEEVVASNNPKPACGVAIPTKKLKEKIEFKCEAADLYRALTERDMVQAFTRAAVTTFKPEKGGPFVLFGDNVTGKFQELEFPKKITMKWRFKTWPDEHFSNVTIALLQKSDCTELTLTQTGIPGKEFDRTKEGWKIYYWQSIKQTFGFETRLS